MPLSALLLLVLSALLHAAYYGFYKRSADKQVFAWWFLLVAVVIYSPALVLNRPVIPAQGWLCLLLSGLADTAYFVIVGKALEKGDLSVVYPLARGTPPLLITLGGVLFLGERLTLWGLAGILLITAGLYLVNVRSSSDLLRPLCSLKKEGPSQLALLASVSVSTYSLIDKVGLRYVAPFAYGYLMLLVTLLAFTPYILLTKHRTHLVAEWWVSRLGIGVAGVFVLLTYFLALAAMRLSYVSYVGSVRSVNVIFAALLGAFLLKEPYGATRVLASSLVFVGVLLIGVAG
jgi:drug/metabolite transporter (DMT)-like permease